MAQETQTQKIPLAADFDTMQARIAILLAKREANLKSLTAASSHSCVPLAKENEDQKAARLSGILQSITEASTNDTKRSGQKLSNGIRQDMGDNGRLRHIMTGKSVLHASKPREDVRKGADGKRNRKGDSSDDEEDGGRSSLGKSKKAKVLVTEARKAAVHPAAQQIFPVDAKAIKIRQDHVAALSKAEENAFAVKDAKGYGNVLQQNPDRKGLSPDDESSDEDTRSSSVPIKTQKINSFTSAGKSILKRPTSTKPRIAPSTPGPQPFSYDIPEASPKKALPTRPVSKLSTTISKTAMHNKDDGSEESELETEQAMALPASSTPLSSSFASSDDTAMQDVGDAEMIETETRVRKRREAKKRQKLAKRERERAAKAAAVETE